MTNRRNEWMTWRYGMHYQAAAAELALARGDLARARHRLDACLATAQRTQSMRDWVRATPIEASCHLVEGNLENAGRCATATVRAAPELSNPPELWHALRVYGEVLRRHQRGDEARAAWREGLASAEATAATLPSDLAAVFRALAAVREPGRARRLEELDLVGAEAIAVVTAAHPHARPFAQGVAIDR